MRAGRSSAAAALPMLCAAVALWSSFGAISFAERDDMAAVYGLLPPVTWLVTLVILAAIAKSDGSRKGVRDAVFSGDGISLSSSDSVLGKPIKIDPKSGDVNTIDISILQMKDQKESFLKPYPVD